MSTRGEREGGRRQGGLREHRSTVLGAVVCRDIRNSARRETLACGVTSLSTARHSSASQPDPPAHELRWSLTHRPERRRCRTADGAPPAGVPRSWRCSRGTALADQTSVCCVRQVMLRLAHYMPCPCVVSATSSSLSTQGFTHRQARRRSHSAHVPHFPTSRIG